MSANSIVTVRRSPAMAFPALADRSLLSISGGMSRSRESSSGSGSGAARFAPQLLQNFAPVGAGVEQTEQVIVSSVPHWAQNFDPG
jgi:hypothetical protein